LVLAVERVVNNGDCAMGARGGGCEIRWERDGHILIEAHLGDDGLAHARLPVRAQVGLRDGRLRFGWVDASAEGVEIVPAPHGRPR
jgi:hypothetical protein